MSGTLLDKVWDLHTVRGLDSGQTQLFIGLHLIHEVTSPQGFQMLEDPPAGPSTAPVRAKTVHSVDPQRLSVS